MAKHQQMLSSSATSTTPESAYAYARLATSLALMTLSGSGMYAVVVALKPIAFEFGTTRSAASVAYGVTMIGFGLGGIIMARWSDRVGVMWPCLTGSIMLVVGFFLASKSASIWHLYLAQGLLIGGIGNGAMFAPLVADATLWFNRRRGIAVAIVASGIYMAGAVWPPILQYFIDQSDWRSTYEGLAIFLLITMPPLCLILYQRSDAVAEADSSNIHANSRPLGLPPNGLQGLLCCAGMACCIAMAVPQAHIVAHATDLGHVARRGAEMLALMLATGTISRLLFGWISDRIGGLATMFLGSGLQALTLLCFMFAESLTALYLMSGLFGLSQGGIVPSYAIVVRRFFLPGQIGWRFSLVLSATFLGMAFGAWVAGLLYDWSGSYRLAFINAVGVNVAHTFLAWWLLKRASARV